MLHPGPGMKRQSHTNFAVHYARIRADLQATEGEAVRTFRRRRAQSRPVEHVPTKQERHRTESNVQRQQGSL